MADLNPQQFPKRVPAHKLYPLFHGSRNELEPGTVIEAGGIRKAAYAALDLPTARVFGKDNVYEVEPLSTEDEDLWEQPMKYSGGMHREVVSKKGFRVVGKLPKSRRDSYYEKRRTEAYERWKAENP